MNKLLLNLCAGALILGTAQADVILNEPFNYVDGPITTVSGGTWANHSGTALQLDVASGKAIVTQAESEDVNAFLSGRPYSTGNLYASFVVNFSALPLTGAGTYFAHFKDDGTAALKARVFATITGAAAGQFRVGVANGGNTPVVIAKDLSLGQDYTLVLRYDTGTGASTLWISPASEGSTTDRADGTDTTGAVGITTFALRQSNANGGMGALTLDDLKVGTSYGDVTEVRTDPPAITVQPSSQVVVAGEAANLDVTAVGASPIAYQWRRDGISIDGAITARLLLLGISTNEAGAYDVVVANAYGSITSSVALVTVVFSPSITVQPMSSVVISGTAVSFGVTAGGTEPFGYQWWNSTGLIPDATNAVYTIDSASTNDAGDYSVVVGNAYGTVTSQAATLTVYVPVAFTSQPSQQVVPFKGTAVFSASADGYPAPSYQWLLNGAVVAGANGSSLLVTNVSTNALGEYSVIAWNTYSAATSSVAMLLMSPSIRAPFLGATAVWGKSATLTASAVGSGELSYQWFKDGAAIPSGTSAMLMFPTVQLTDAGLYSVVVSSLWGSVTNAPAQLVVNPANISLAMYAGVTIEGVAGYTYGIQYSTDLRNTNAWITVTNYTLSVPVETWIDMESAGGLKRFYRVVVP